jgi:uncharacterized damage-inducible protein DinB
MLPVMSYNQLITDYEQGAQLLSQAIAGMTTEQLKARPIPGKWTTLELICHIADFEPVYADRMKRVIAEDNPPLLSGDPDLFLKGLAYHDRDAQEEIALIDVVRKQMARILRTLPDSAFARVGTHSRDGALSLETLLKRITGHIPHHAKFIAEKRAAL